MRIGIIAALPGELRPLVRGWKRLPVETAGVFLWHRAGEDGDEVTAACAGMGVNAARRAFAALEQGGPVDLVLSIGWAGALTQETKLSTCSVVSEIVDAQTGERFALTEAKRTLRLVTTARVADEAEKQRLWRAYGAVLVDMEAAAIARLARIRGIPMCCFKAVSDEAEAKLPDLNAYIDGSGQMRMAAFLAYVAVRPWFWMGLLKLGRTSSAAAVALAATTNAFLRDKDVEGWNRRGFGEGV